MILNVWSEKKYGWDAFSEGWSLFRIEGSSLAVSYRAPVNWDRWAAPEE